MKIIKIHLTPEQKALLDELQINGSGLLRERSLAVLHCAANKKIKWIANVLNRTPLTIRTWIGAFEVNGIDGLQRVFSPGRPSIRKQKLLPRLKQYLNASPREYGWKEDVWTTKVINAQFEKDFGKKFGKSTITRLLKDNNYSFKRAKKTPPLNAPLKSEKLQRIHEIAKEILEVKNDYDVEVVFIDESHFSTDPYIVRGWHKKGIPFFPADTKNTAKLVSVWRIQSKHKEIILEEFSKN